ncbi:unnamed protein product [Musa acuminata subsp. malaccensis]|uniref:(wild Malaysian banana) hypothetical protein n=1 Tax=Musa acuminata subsp. malaccensis TaxID=214687 RepID=A0A804KDD0_MUSAM|nr:unnamed protein product [Musa acuminata subsp. malaccensis]
MCHIHDAKILGEQGLCYATLMTANIPHPPKIQNEY